MPAPVRDREGPPAPPTVEEERKLARLFRWGFSGELYAQPQDPPPPEWGAQAFGIPRKTGGLLAGLMFPHEAPRGVVLLGHPGIPPGKGYFHRNERIPFARSLGLTVATFDHGGFGESDGPTGLYHNEWEDVLGWARRRFPDMPLHVWGVSLGGYFAHHALARDPGVAGAVFEEVTPDLTRYGNYVSGRLGRVAARVVMPTFLQWFPATAHAPFLHAERVLYVHGGKDHGISRADADALVKAAGPLAQRVLVPDAGHLESWKTGGDTVRDAVRKTLGA